MWTIALLVTACRPAPPAPEAEDPHAAMKRLAAERHAEEEAKMARLREEWDRERREADAKFEEGREAFRRWEASGRAQRAELDASYEAFQACTKLGLQIRCWANLASVCFHLGRPVEAARSASYAIIWLRGEDSIYPLEDTEDERREALEKAKALEELIALVRPRVGTVRIRGCPWRSPILVDGTEIDRCPSKDDPHEIYVEPGAHEIEITCERPPAVVTQVDVRAGQVSELREPACPD
jgi:hypothetical protein